MPVNTKVFSLLVSVVLITFPVIAQRTRTIPLRPLNGVGSPFSWGLKLSYYSPKTTNVGGVFNKLEDSVGLPHGSGFHIYYAAGATMRCSLDGRNDIGLEGAMSYGQSKLSNVLSYARVYTVNAQYYYHLQERKPGFYGVDLGGGVGWLFANFERDYGDKNHRIAVLAQSVQANGAVQWWAALTRTLYLELEARYVYTPVIKMSDPQMSVDMSSVQLSAGFSVVL